MILDVETPLIQLFPEILNRDVFLFKHPKLNPELYRHRYISYWREEKKRCIEGFWGEEKKNHWRYMNPDLYFYANHWIITEQRESGEEISIRPYLRDVDWYFFSVWTVCRKFSGFMDDEEYNGHYLLKKYWRQQKKEKDEHGELIELSKIEIKRLERSKHAKNSEGEYKKYKDPFEIISEAYDYPMGLPCYENPAQDLMCFSSRSMGKSFWSSAIIGREYTFDGKRYLDSNVDKGNNEISTTVESGKAFAGSYEDKHVDLLYNKVFSGLDSFVGGYETLERVYPPPFFKSRAGTFSSKNSIKHEYRVYFRTGGNRVKGSGSTLYKGIYSTNINQAIGNRVNVAVVDESGLIPNIREVHGANRNTLERGGRKNGSVLYIGTGGDIKRIDGSKSLFYNPSQNRLYSFKNQWEESQDICMFIPAEYSLNEFRDENGNTDLVGARQELLKRREETAVGDDTTQYDMERMYMPIRPSEMFLIDGDLVYNQQMVMNRIAEIKSLDSWRKNATFGEIICFGTHFDDVQIKRGSFEDMKPIVTRAISDRQDTTGCIIFYKEPDGTEEFKKLGSRYRIAYDPVRKEGAHINKFRSFASIIVWDSKHDKVAAEFIGRRETPEEIHDICLNLGIYYNCPILYESNVRGFKNMALRRGLGYMLYPTPIKALSKKIAGLTYTEGDVGIEVTGKIKPTLIEFSQSFVNKRDRQGLTVYEKLNSLRLLEEMETWDGEINADHISAFLMLSVWEEQEKEGVPMETPKVTAQYNEFRKVMEKGRMHHNILYSVYR